jgi:hypothetical protein
MENNMEIMNEGIEAMVDNVVVDNAVAKGNGMAVLKGAGLALAVVAGIKLAVNAYKTYQTNKELRQPDKETVVEDKDVEEVVAE